MPLKELAERRNTLHRKSDAQTLLRHALSDVQIGKVAVVSSFGAESVVLLHMVAQIDKATPVIFLDTEMPCTTRVSDHENARAGRWRDSQKTECGIHFASVD